MCIGYSKKRPKALVVLLAAAGLSGCWVNLAELNLLVVFRDALSTDHGASVVHVLGLGADVVTALPECTNETEALATAGETADKRSCALVLSAADLYAYGVLHTRNIAYWGISCLGRVWKRPRVLVDARAFEASFRLEGDYLAPGDPDDSVDHVAEHADSSEACRNVHEVQTKHGYGHNWVELRIDAEV